MTDAPDTVEATTGELWRRAAERAIGASVDTLRRRSTEGLEIAPLYPPNRHPEPQPWRRDAVWTLAQRLDHPEAEAANALALADVEGGAGALVLVDAASPFARGFGFDVARGDLGAALAGVELDFIDMRIDAGTATPDALDTMAALVEQRRLTSASLKVDIGYDPIGLEARLGKAINRDRLSQVFETRARAGLSGTTLLADGRPWHEAGAGEAQELAAALASGVAYLRQQDALGIAVDEARQNIAILLAADADIILGIAKIRAIRRLWARVEAACGLEPATLRLHVETSWRMMARHDPWTNVMRTTASVFAAGIGGADAVCVLPLTLPLGLPDEPARRLARNSQTILIEEAFLAKVADPASGAGGFETLTSALCDDAWTRFQDIEREGGFPRSIPSLRIAVADTARIRAAELATLKSGIVGTSRFSSLDAWRPKVLDVASRSLPEPRPDGLPSLRDAAPFEALRARADLQAESQPRPQVFLATLGTPATFGPQADYAVNYFATAGIVAETSLVARDIDELLAALKASGTPIVCLCGRPETYTREAPTFIPKMRAAGATRILAVGEHGTIAGVDDFLCDDVDAIGVLSTLLDIIGHRPGG